MNKGWNSTMAYVDSIDWYLSFRLSRLIQTFHTGANCKYRYKLSSQYKTNSCHILPGGVRWCQEGVIWCQEGVIWCQEGVILCQEGASLCKEGIRWIEEGVWWWSKGMVMLLNSLTMPADVLFTNNNFSKIFTVFWGPNKTSHCNSESRMLTSNFSMLYFLIKQCM